MAMEVGERWMLMLMIIIGSNTHEAMYFNMFQHRGRGRVDLPGFKVLHCSPSIM